MQREHGVTRLQVVRLVALDPAGRRAVQVAAQRERQLLVDGILQQRMLEAVLPARAVARGPHHVFAHQYVQHVRQIVRGIRARQQIAQHRQRKFTPDDAGCLERQLFGRTERIDAAHDHAAQTVGQRGQRAFVDAGRKPAQARRHVDVARGAHRQHDLFDVKRISRRTRGNERRERR